MKTTTNRLSAVLIASALSLAAGTTLAQSTKPAPKASKAKAAGKDKLQTKEELRACMMLKESNNARSVELEQRNADSLKQKALLSQAPDSGAAAAKADVQAKLDAVNAMDGQLKEVSQAFADWTERMNEFEKNSKEMRNADRRRQVLKDERYALKAKNDKLIAERELKIKEYEASVQGANEKITAGAKAAEAWNKNNEQLADEQERLSASRDKWMDDCANRRFIDTDEKEIKAEMKASK